VGRVFATSGLIFSLVCAAPAVSQTEKPSAIPACPPDVRGEPPTVGGPSTPDLSDRLADSRGVICPPAGHDPDIQVPPPGGGKLKVLPAPGTPEGNPNVQPK
jgi:hypothetical protein